MWKCRVSALLLLALAAGSATGADAQSPAGSQLDVAALEAVMQQELQRRAAIEAIAANRQQTINSLLSAYADEADARFGAGWRDELQAVLIAASPERLFEATAARTYAELVNALSGKPVSARTSQSLADPRQALGDDATDTVYFPVAPCRVLDTRAAGGAFVNGTTRSYRINGDMTSQGGATSCGVPTDPAAAAVTVTVTQTVGVGFLTAYAFGSALPGASTINFNSGSELANTTIVPVCQVCGNDISITAGTTGSTHVVVDIVGYFWSPLATALQQSNQISAPETVAAGGTATTTSPACPTGYSVTGGSCIVNSFNMHLVTSRKLGNAWFCSVENEGASSTTFQAEVICSRVPGR